MLEIKGIAKKRAPKFLGGLVGHARDKGDCQKESAKISWRSSGTFKWSRDMERVTSKSCSLYLVGTSKQG